MKSPDDFSRWLIDHLAISTDTNTVDLIPAPCGIGKSYSMTVQISEALRNHSGGVIIVTDELDRMREYVNAGNMDNYIGSYIDRNRDRILVYTAANARADRDKLYKVPVIVMSTQRFFSLSRAEVIALAATYIPKRHVFIDERAPLSETIRIDLGVLNYIDTVIDAQLDNTATEKEWLLQQWRNLRTRYDTYMKDYERSHDDYELRLWHVDNDTHATTDDDNFSHLVFSTYADKLRRTDHEILKKLRAVLQLVREGALFISRRKPTSRSTNDYDKFFLVTLDHSDLLIDIGAKTVILDGSGDLDPVYTPWFVNRVDCSEFRRDLSKLTINIVDTNTSRNAIARAPTVNAKLRAILEYVQTLPKVDAVFTYGKGKAREVADSDTVERVFHNAGYMTGHFGGLKGTNKFRRMANLVQVGLNRTPDEYYLAAAIHNVSSKYPPDITHISAINFDKVARRVMIQSLLADVEQNIFRGVIRNIENQSEQVYYLLYKAKPQIDKNGIHRNDLSDLTEAIRERYEAMGATVNVLDTPNTVMKLKTKDRKAKDGDKTNPQRVLDFVSNLPSGMVFTSRDVIKGCNITKEQFDNAKKNTNVKLWLKNHRRDNRHYVA